MREKGKVRAILGILVIFVLLMFSGCSEKAKLKTVEMKTVDLGEFTMEVPSSWTYSVTPEDGMNTLLFGSSGASSLDGMKLYIIPDAEVNSLVTIDKRKEKMKNMMAVNENIFASVKNLKVPYGKAIYGHSGILDSDFGFMAVEMVDGPYRIGITTTYSKLDRKDMKDLMVEMLRSYKPKENKLEVEEGHYEVKWLTDTNGMP